MQNLDWLLASASVWWWIECFAERTAEKVSRRSETLTYVLLRPLLVRTLKRKVNPN